MKAYLDHVGIAVRDLGAALAFYRDALGLDVEGAEEVASQRVRAHFIPAGAASLDLDFTALVTGEVPTQPPETTVPPTETPEPGGPAAGGGPTTAVEPSSAAGARPRFTG